MSIDYANFLILTLAPTFTQSPNSIQPMKLPFLFFKFIKIDQAIWNNRHGNCIKPPPHPHTSSHLHLCMWTLSERSDICWWGQSDRKLIFCYRISEIMLLLSKMDYVMVNFTWIYLYLPTLWPSSTAALPSNASKSAWPARRPCNICNVNHCLSCDVNNVVVPSSDFVWAKQWLSLVVKSRRAPPKSVRRRFGNRASSAALYKLADWFI